MNTIEQEKILLTEDREGIESLKLIPEFNARALNSLHNLIPIRTIEEARTVVTSAKYTIREMMERHHKKFTEVVTDVMTLKMPDNIRAIQSAIEGVAIRMKSQDKRLPGHAGFQLVIFDGNSWVVDNLALEEIFDQRYRKYAHTERQLEILKFSNDLANVLNNFSIGPITRQNNFKANEFVVWDNRAERWTANIKTVVNSETKDSIHL